MRPLLKPYLEQAISLLSKLINTEGEMNLKFSIKYKIISCFSVLFFLALLILIIFTTSRIDANNEAIIKKEVLDIKKHSDIYLNQLFLTSNVSSEKFFDNYGKQIIEELSYKIGDRVLLYTKNGDFLLDSSENHGVIIGSSRDLAMAKNNKVAYSINYNKNVVHVNFSYVVNLDKKDIGIIRYEIDYSDIYKFSKYL